MKHLVIISGGQTGVDRAALDVALKLNIACSGWCPRGRWAEDGPLEERYPLKETRSTDPKERTEKNILESDGTLVLTGQYGADRGTETTEYLARIYDKPLISVPLAENEKKQIILVLNWMQMHEIARLNVAGPRESHEAGMYEMATRFLHGLIESIPGRPDS
jgi:predicted Rossmann-fold nucleotide-binding protein